MKNDELGTLNAKKRRRWRFSCNVDRGRWLLGVRVSLCDISYEPRATVVQLVLGPLGWQWVRFGGGDINVRLICDTTGIEKGVMSVREAIARHRTPELRDDRN